MEGNRGDEVEMTLVIYRLAGDSGSEAEDADSNSNLKTQHQGINHAVNTCYTVTLVCLLLLCALLITAVTVLWIKLNILTTENNQLPTRYNTLTAERDQLKANREELQMFIKLGWILFSSSIYKISTEEKSWTESRQDCREQGADLVIINSRDEQEFINKLRANRKSWIGLNDRDRHGKWEWVDNTPLIAEYWSSGEPNDEDEHCVLTGERSEPVRTWADYPCKSQFIWICEKAMFL